MSAIAELAFYRLLGKLAFFVMLVPIGTLIVSTVLWVIVMTITELLKNRD